MPSEQELADMQRMSNDYIPDVTGPLVSVQQSTQALVAEYAQADPVYVHKTVALPAKFSHYRTVKGDGNCGWRALAFGYFEALLRLGDPVKVRAEIARLKGCNTMLENVGFGGLYDEFADETFILLEHIASMLPNHDGGASLLTTFNDLGTSSAITYHFRLLTSAWMKMYPHFYEDFVTDMDVNTYCLQHIEPASIELEHLGLQCLATSVINEAGIAIDVLYLDRSEGNEVNSHQWHVCDGEGIVEGTPTIRLLYRPGHYDLLYKSEDVAEMAIGEHRQPEIRFLPDTPCPTFGENEVPYFGELPPWMAELPLFTLGAPPTSFSTEPYPSLSQTSTVQGIMSSARPDLTQLTHTTSGLSVNENDSFLEQSVPLPSPKSQFRMTGHLFEYDAIRTDLRSQQAQAGLASDNPDMTKKEDPAHFTNEAFQPHMWQPQPSTDSDTDTAGKGSS